MIRYIIVFILFAFPCLAGMGIGGFPYPGPGSNQFRYDYCVRADGTATKLNATSCDSTTTSMSVATLNASTFSSGEEIAFSGAGGVFTSAVVVPSGGDVGFPVTYKGDPSNLPVWTGAANWLIKKSYVILKDLEVDSVTNSSFEFGDATNTYAEIITHNLISKNSSNQSFQHLDGVTVTHYNLTAELATDEGISLHNDNSGVSDPIVTIYGLKITNCTNGLNWVGSPTLSVYDFSISGGSATGKSIDGSTVSGGTYVFERGSITEHPDQNARVIDCSMGNWMFKNVIFLNLSDADYYLLGKSTVSGFKVINCTFKGDGVNSTTAIFNQFAGSYLNNIFDNVITNGLYGTSGTISNNLYNNSGTARGVNVISGDPMLSSTGRLTASSTLAFAAGIGPAVNALIPTNDIDKEARSGNTTDVGADQH